ncbi:hypothetical protein AFV7_gp31 [Betalipothrixvirus pezzuloense]|uniref:Uncharacterized protein n=1 Tax=Betalipothrixvirus pezzuloense TaxID=346883 RepID=A7WKP9_9VIRU|nr:hypothetical protein AFV7_gp31 [Acidianus filamentous virus 7]CAJ31651.1 conserved hypothetical protein [Acidianus filamentous virus 7]
MSLCLRQIGGKLVLYIPAYLESNFEVGKVYPVVVGDKVVPLKCVRTAKRKVLYIPSSLSDLFAEGCYTFKFL